MISTGLIPGAAAVNVMMRMYFNADLTHEQANKLWVDCRKRLNEDGKSETVKAAEAAYYGELDYGKDGNRSNLADAICVELAGMPHPPLTGPNGLRQVFDQKVKATFSKRGYLVAPVQISLFSPW